MGVANFSELKTEISDHLDRDDLSDNVDTFIRLAEARHERDIRINQMLTRATANASARYLALPAGFLEMKQLRLLTNPVTVLEELNFHEMNRQRSETTGKPTMFVVHEDIEFDKAPDSTYTAEMVYYKAFDRLSNSNTTNGLLDRAPDAYLYGALVSAEPFLMNDERINLWAQLYKDAVSSLNMMDRRKGGPLVSKVVGRGP